MNMYIDIVGACNLSCPSCPMGNSENVNFKKAMQVDMFRKIVEKARNEGGRDDLSVQLDRAVDPPANR